MSHLIDLHQLEDNEFVEHFFLHVENLGVQLLFLGWLGPELLLDAQKLLLDVHLLCYDLSCLHGNAVLGIQKLLHFVVVATL